MRSTRRDALKAIGSTATLAGLVALPTRIAGAASTPRPAGKGKAAPAGGAPVTAVWLQDLHGARFGGCLVHDVSAVEHGCIAVTFSDAAGAFFVVDILRDDPATPGVARAGTLGVYMRIDGEGRRTNEEHGLAAMALAAELGRRGAAGLEVSALQTLNERAAARRSA